MVDITDTDDVIMTRQQAADFLKISVSLLEAWAFRGTGPQFYKIGSRSTRYAKKDLMAWLANYKATKHKK